MERTLLLPYYFKPLQSCVIACNHRGIQWWQAGLCGKAVWLCEQTGKTWGPQAKCRCHQLVSEKKWDKKRLYESVLDSSKGRRTHSRHIHFKLHNTSFIQRLCVSQTLKRAKTYLMFVVSTSPLLQLYFSHHFMFSKFHTWHSTLTIGFCFMRAY